MTFTQAVRSVFSQYVGFNGRARRSEFWWFMLFEILVSMVCGMLGNMTGSNIFNGLLGIFNLAVLLPSLAVYIRRLHDTGKSGWWTLLMLTGIGSIVVLVFCAMDSEPGPNKYGANPKGM